jgi:hypothetical protein
MTKVLEVITFVTLESIVFEITFREQDSTNILLL